MWDFYIYFKWIFIMWGVKVRFVKYFIFFNKMAMGVYLVCFRGYVSMCMHINYAAIATPTLPITTQTIVSLSLFHAVTR